MATYVSINDFRTMVSPMSGEEGIADFVSDVYVDHLRKVDYAHREKRISLVVGVHIEWSQSQLTSMMGLLTFCAESRCSIIPVEKNKQFHRILLDFIDDPDIYFMGVDIKNCLGKINLQVRKAVDVGVLCAQTLRRPVLAVFNATDVAHALDVGSKISTKPMRFSV